ncbi:host attachment protein [Aquicoccus sp.]|uniref:baeRF12 domain-containing protein n=1 Tax=Aquicoccus sp. TaxID=2055851 RepID=UPI0035692802
MKPVKTLILLASESRLRLCANSGVGKGVDEIAARTIEEFDDIARRYADAPGQQRAAPGMAGHEFERPTSERRQKREDFATHVLEMTTEAFEAGGYDRLLIAAPPAMLGALRDEMSEKLKSVLLADLDKDLTKLPLADLPGHLEDIIAL